MMADGVKHKSKPAVHGFKAHVGADATSADATSALVEKVRAPELDLLSTRAGVAGTVGFLFTCVPVRRSEWAAV